MYVHDKTAFCFIRMLCVVKMQLIWTLLVHENAVTPQTWRRPPAFTLCHAPSWGKLLNKKLCVPYSQCGDTTRSNCMSLELDRKVHELTNCMEQDPASDAQSSSASLEIPCILWNLEAHNLVHSSVLLVPILSQVNPVFDIHINIIHPSTLRCSKCSLLFKFPYQNPVCIFLSHTCHMPNPSHPPRFVHPNNIQWAVQILKPLILSSLILDPSILLIALFANTSAYVLPLTLETQFNAIKNNRQHYNSLSCNIYLDSKWEEKMVDQMVLNVHSILSALIFYVHATLVSVVPRYLNLAIFSKDLQVLAIFMLNHRHTGKSFSVWS